MSAVDPRRLRFQMDELMAFYESPRRFRQQLKDLFNLYANRTLHPGDSVPTRPLIPIYNLPKPVIRQLKIDLDRKIIDLPHMALALADELWLDDHLEIKQTAIQILGSVPIQEPDAVLSRISQWLSPKLDKTLTNFLFSTGARQLQSNFSSDWEKFIRSLLDMNQPEWIALGIKGLSQSLENPEYQNVPAIFRLLSPILREPHSAFLQDLQHLMIKLIQSSPAETALFLKQALSMSNSPQTIRLIKACLDHFPHEFRIDLEAALKILR